MTRSSWLAAGFVVLVAVAAVFLWRGRAVDDGTLGDDHDQITPSSQFTNAAEAVEYYRAVLRREPEAVEPRVRLAHALLQLADETGDEAQYVPEARTLLDEAIARDPKHYYGRTLQASLLNKLHRFEDARDLSNALLAEYPEHAYTHGTLIDALVELGEYDEAVRVSDRMLSIRPGLPSYSRASYLRELHGDTDGAIAAMRLAADAEPSGRPSRSWALLQLGQLYLGQARLDTAAYVFNGILEETPNFTPALTALGHVALVEGDTKEAIFRLEESRALKPAETTDALLVEAYTLAGEEAKARAANQRVLKWFDVYRTTGEIVDMEEADFLADQDEDLDRALTMAEAQVRRRPGHLHANETYAWALHKTGRSAEAIPYIERAMRLGTGDAMVHYRAGRIYQGAGRMAEAARQLRLAVDGHVRIESPIAGEEARQLLASMGSARVQAASLTP